MSGTTEAFARFKIDTPLGDAGWNLTEGTGVLFEQVLPDGIQADHMLCDRQGRPMAALKVKRVGTDPIMAQDQGSHYAEQLGVPFVFLSNGEDVWFLDRVTDAHARRIAGFHARDDLGRRIPVRRSLRDLSTVPIDRRIVDRDYRIACIEALSAEVMRGRRRLLVEMAKGTGRTRMAAAGLRPGRRLGREPVVRVSRRHPRRRLRPERQPAPAAEPGEGRAPRPVGDTRGTGGHRDADPGRGRRTGRGGAEGHVGITAYHVFRLREIANVVAGDPAPQEPGTFAPDGPLSVRMQDVGLNHGNPDMAYSTDRLSPDWLAGNRLRLFPKHSTLIPKSGASVNLNHRAKLATDAHVVSQLAVVMLDKSGIDPDHLFWWSVHYDPLAQAQVASLPSLKLPILKEARVPLPPLSEQRRIVGILNRAAETVRPRAQKPELMREFIPAPFVKMFGDPAANPMALPGQKAGEVGIESEHRDPARNPVEKFRYVDISGVDCIRREINAVRSILGAKAPSRARKDIRADDVLLSSLRPDLNAVAIVPDQLDGGIASTGLCVLRPNRKAPHLFSYVTSTHFIGTLVSKAWGANYPAVSEKGIGEIRIPLSPLHMQSRFSEIAEAAQGAVASAELGSQASASLSHSLMSDPLDKST